MFGDTFQGLTIILCCNLSLIALICFVFKKGYQRTTIGIDQNSVTYDHDFLWKKRKDVLFRDIKEIELKAGLLQKIFGLGTIVLHTHATVSGNRQSGIALRDLENGEKIYTELKQMINQAKSEK